MGKGQILLYIGPKKFSLIFANVKYRTMNEALNQNQGPTNNNQDNRSKLSLERIPASAGI